MQGCIGTLLEDYEEGNLTVTQLWDAEKRAKNTRESDSLKKHWNGVNLETCWGLLRLGHTVRIL